MVGAERTERSRKNEPNVSVLATSLTNCRRENMLHRIVTGDESWVHHYQPKSKHASMQWKHPSSPSTKTFNVISLPSAGMVMLTMFWDFLGVLLAHFHNCGENWNSSFYCEVLLKLQDPIHKKKSRTIGKRGTASSRQCQTPYSPSNPEENRFGPW
jgi:hypothetical protein